MWRNISIADTSGTQLSVLYREVSVIQRQFIYLSRLAAVGEPPKTPMDPCDRVKFILGVEEEDGATTGTTPHEVFTELDELCMHHGEPVWKETARCVSVVRVTSSSFHLLSYFHLLTLHVTSPLCPPPVPHSIPTLPLSLTPSPSSHLSPRSLQVAQV